MSDFDRAYESFEKYMSLTNDYISTDLNESDTRSKLIDELLITVLGWDESDIIREGKVESGYFDYFISIPGVNFIVEAKRSFTNFSIPNKNRKIKNKALYSSNSSLFNQIRNYAIDKGSQYGLLINGSQIILSKLINIDGKDWKENTCLVFNSLKDINENFVEFYDNLSKVSVTDIGGFKFEIPSSSPSYTKITSTLIDRDKELVRNSLSASLSPIIERFFGEIYGDFNMNDEEFIQQCFVENLETKKNRDEIYRLFADKPPQLSNIVKAVNTDNIKRQILSKFTTEDISIHLPTPPKPIIIIGTKGAGKTTFINHLLNNSSLEIDLEKHLVAYIDLRRQFESEKFDAQKIANAILNDVYEKYENLKLYSFEVLKQIYLKEIRYNDESIWKYTKLNDLNTYNRNLSDFFTKKKEDNLIHLEFLNKYLIRERRKRLIVILDNADQFNQTIQENSFLFAQSLSKSCLCGIILSLREGYYYKWRHAPPFDAYESNVYHITAPKYSEVLSKRLNYTLQKIGLDEGSSIGVSSKGYKMTIPNSSVIGFLTSLKTSLFSDDNEELINFLSYTTYPNIREGLAIFKQFLVSGHTNVEEYIFRGTFQTKNERISVPIHEFVKSIGLNNKLYYDSDISIIHNIFIPPNDTEDHFLHLYILKDLVTLIETKGIIGKYTSYSDLLDKFINFSYRPTTVKDAFTRLMKYNLVDSDDNMNDIEWWTIPHDIKISITAKGHYYYKELITRFHYFDLILQDTPIYLIDSFTELKTNFPLYGVHDKRSLLGRLKSVELFIEYLNKMHSRQPQNLISTYGDMIQYIKTGLSSDLERVKLKVNK